MLFLFGGYLTSLCLNFVCELWNQVGCHTLALYIGTWTNIHWTQECGMWEDRYFWEDWVAKRGKWFSCTKLGGIECYGLFSASLGRINRNTLRYSQYIILYYIILYYIILYYYNYIDKTHPPVKLMFPLHFKHQFIDMDGSRNY